MAIIVTWDNEKKTVIKYQFQGRWTWAEYYAAIAKGAEMVQDLTYVVNLIIDLTDTNLVPDNLLSRVSSSIKSPPRPYDLAIIVSTSFFIDSIVRILSRLNTRLGEKHMVVKSIEEARVILADYDRTRRTSPAPDNH